MELCFPQSELSYHSYAKNHADVPRFSNYVIMPMAYLCNTFFSTEKLPGFLGKFVSALPLSQTSHMIRSISAGRGIWMLGNRDTYDISDRVYSDCIMVLAIDKKRQPLAKITGNLHRIFEERTVSAPKSFSELTAEITIF